MCKHHKVKVIRAGATCGVHHITLRQLSTKLDSTHLQIDTRKRHFTAGFYAKLIERAVRLMLGDEASKLQSAEGKVAWEGDVGGFRDVGKHDGVAPLSTCWPLVEQVFSYVAEEVWHNIFCCIASN